MADAAASSSALAWPWHYSFPPFFTLQPNLDTRAKQLEAWCDLVLQYTRHLRMDTLDVTEAAASPLFFNAKINRRLSREGIDAVLQELEKRGNINWTDASKSKCLVFYRTAAQWGDVIYRWAVDAGMTGTVCTLFELTEGDTGRGQEFHGMDSRVMIEALRTLEAKRKAAVFQTDDDQASTGVKFL